MKTRRSDQRVERILVALVCGVVGLLLAMIVTVFIRGWPSFSHNGLSWFAPGGNVDDQLNEIFLSGQSGAEYVYTFANEERQPTGLYIHVNDSLWYRSQLATEDNCASKPGSSNEGSWCVFLGRT